MPAKKLSPQNKHKKTQQRREQQQDFLKKKWKLWLSRFSDEQEALAEGVFYCEKLARHLACSVKSYHEDYYIYYTPELDENLLRLCQFNGLKNLWLKRNIPNILTVKKLPYIKPRYLYRFAFTEFWADTFFSYYENVQLYLYHLKINSKEYSLFSDILLNLECQPEEKQYLYDQFLPLAKQQKIGESFGELVQIIEWGSHKFWKKYWSKKENKLTLLNN